MRYLRKRGYRVLARNFAGPGGEVDIVAARREWLVFVEVKTRGVTRAGRRRHGTAHPTSGLVTATEPHPITHVTADQLRRIERTARYVMTRPGSEGRPARIDLIVVRLDPDSGRSEISHVEDAPRFMRTHGAAGTWA